MHSMLKATLLFNQSKLEIKKLILNPNKISWLKIKSSSLLLPIYFNLDTIKILILCKTKIKKFPYHSWWFLAKKEFRRRISTIFKSSIRKHIIETIKIKWYGIIQRHSMISFRKFRNKLKKRKNPIFLFRKIRKEQLILINMMILIIAINEIKA
jgi:hypothetical protein